MIGDNITEMDRTQGSGSLSTGQKSGPEADIVCDGDHLLRILRAGGAWLEAHIADVNALNVFPVPDGDTGTNMSLTMRAALDEAGAVSYSSVGELGRKVAHGALMGARGNSGVILSQVLRGFARSLDSKVTLTGVELADAMAEGATTAYKGVMKPVEGTILTVARESSEAAKNAAAMGAGIRLVLEAAVQEARASLARTPSLLPVLAAAGVVDAGGQGLTMLYEGMLRCVRGESVVATSTAQQMVEHAEAIEGDYNYDTQFIIQGTSLDVDAIRDRIATMGDSVLVVGDVETVKVHVHSDDPGMVLTYGTTQGQLTAVIIENMQLQYEEFKANLKQQPTRTMPSMQATTLLGGGTQMSDVSVIAVVVGEGLRRVFESLGVSAIVTGGQTMNPSTQDLLQAIEAVTTDKVIILPNNSNIFLAAEQAVGLTQKQVRVVHTRTIPQGIAALLAFNYQADLNANSEQMESAAGDVQTAEVTRAVRSAQVNGLSITEGQIIGLLNDELVTAGEDEVAVVQDLFSRIHAERYEIVTIYYGQEISLERANQLADAMREHYEGVEIEVLNGGQALYHYIISVE